MKLKRSGLFRNVLAVLLVMTMLFPCAAQAQEAAEELPFLDVDSGQWFAPAVQYVYSHGLMKGVSEDAFDPESRVSRCMAVTVLYRMEQEPETEDGKGALPFADVAAGLYYSDAVRWAASESIVDGYGDGNFGPLDTITREQLAKILYNYAKYAGLEPGEPADAQFADWSAVSAWAREAMQWAVEEQLIQGDAGRLLPQDPLSRKQLAQILQRTDEKIEQQKNASGGQEDPGPHAASGILADNMAALMPQDKNWALSPYSLEMCMAMFANGIKGTTKEEFLDVLGITDLDAYNKSAAALLSRYDTYNNVMNLETANSIWLNQSEFGGKGRFLESFSGTLRDHYRADAIEVTSADSVERINAWAREKTHGLIDRIAEEDNRDFATAVANALYFKAGWALPFDESNTKLQTFFNQDGTESSVPFMHQRDTFGYYSSDGVQAVKMDYSNTLKDPKTGKTLYSCSDADFSMYILLTGPEGGYTGGEGMLSSDEDGNSVDSIHEIDLQAFLDKAEFHSAKVDLTIPKFKIEYGGSLDRELQALGIHTAYNPNLADLTGMVDPALLGGRKLYLDSVVQKVSVNVDETGTEAAAVTVMYTKRNTSVDPSQVVKFRADRPFLFAIRDNTSGQILFSGAYVKASA